MAIHADRPGESPDAWFRHGQQLAVTGVHSVAGAQKIALQLDRFRACFVAHYVEGL